LKGMCRDCSERLLQNLSTDGSNEPDHQWVLPSLYLYLLPSLAILATVDHNAKYGNSLLDTELPQLAICAMNPYECFLEVYKELEFSFMSFSVIAGVANCDKSAIAAKSCQIFMHYQKWQYKRNVHF